MVDKPLVIQLIAVTAIVTVLVVISAPIWSLLVVAAASALARVLTLRPQAPSQPQGNSRPELPRHPPEATRKRKTARA